MLIGLHDAEFERFKNKSYPNYALMKISAWHRLQGDTVEMFIPADPNMAAPPLADYPPRKDASAYDMVYSSKVFDYTPENPFLPENAIKGGTGYGLFKDLPKEIDAMFPDYTLYPTCNYAIGYITRGCPNCCPWCYVPQKEGNIRPYRRWRQLVRPDSDKLVLMDNNILASRFGINQLASLIGSGYKIDINQGMDARLVDEYIADILARLKWIRYIRFSCDTIPQIDAIIHAAELLQKRGVKPYRLFVYLLVTPDLGNAEYRVQQLKRLKGINLYAQAERNEPKGIVPNRAQLEFAQRYVYGRCYKKETWCEYCERWGTDFGERKM